MNPKAHKILVVGPAWVGDMVMAQVLFKTLKSLHPEAVIDVFAPAWTNALLGFMPEVNQGIVSPFTHGEFKAKLRYQLGKKLRTCNYTNAIVLPNSFKSALIPFLAKIPIRTGWVGEMRWGLLNDIRYLDKSALPLMIQRFAALAMPMGISLPAQLPKPKFNINPKMVFQALHEYELAMPARPVLGLCPGAEFGPSKRWTTQHFAEVAKNKLDAGWDVWIFGSAKDWNVAEEIQAQVGLRCVNLAGRTTLEEAVVLMSLLSAVVTNDSGLMHVAAALDIPIVAIYGSSSPQFTPPLSDKAQTISLNLECSPCFKRECPLKHHKCMTDLTAQKVLHALGNLR